MQLLPPPPAKSLLAAGFTLIELSIVLVIIGLIVGGVLVGQTLIEAAGLRATISQLEKIQTAVSAFRLKYNCLAGDCARATTFGLGANGNGDDFIALTDLQLAESINFWAQLSAGGLSEFSPSGSGFVSPYPLDPMSFPKSKLGSDMLMVPASMMDPGSIQFTGYAVSGVRNFIVLQTPDIKGMSPTQALTIDQKIDDGLPSTLSSPAPKKVGVYGAIINATNTQFNPNSNMLYDFWGNNNACTHVTGADFANSTYRPQNASDIYYYGASRECVLSYRLDY